ncbi:MAG: pilus assembly protein PilP [Marinicellaceae bacterium]
MKITKSLILITFSIALISCNTDKSDLDRFFAESNKIPAKQIEPLPEINSPELFIYEADNLRDPFSNDLEILDTLNKDEVPVVVGEGPDLNRRKETLENFPLDGLYMVGTYYQDGTSWGLIEDPEKVIHRVSVFEHVGQNFGEIISISEDEINVSEWVADGLGGWIKREASIALREE